MREQLDLVQQVYQQIITFLVEQSFQVLGALLVVAAGFMVARWVAAALLRVQERRDVDVTLRKFISSAVRFVILAMFIGVIVGTYSSVFVASPILLAWQGKQTKKKG